MLALTSVGVYGVILAGWASNSKYAFLGAMRSAAQIVAYEIAMGFALVGVIMAAGSLNLGDIVTKQSGGFLAWNWFWLFPLFVVYFISGVAETNRAPFDVAEGEVRNRRRLPREYSSIASRCSSGRIRERSAVLGGPAQAQTPAAAKEGDGPARPPPPTVGSRPPSSSSASSATTTA